jgi:hypothetical protein
MNARSSFLLTVSLSLISSGCASTMKEKITRNTLIASAIGAGVGSTREVYKSSHALMYGATAGLLTAAVSLYYYDPDKENEGLKRETATLKAKLDQFENPILLDSGKSLFKSQIPGELSKLVNPGSWKHFSLNQWIQDPNNPNVWIKQVEMYEILPPGSGN